MGRHPRAAIVLGTGYLVGLASLPYLPGPYWTSSASLAARLVLAFSLPATASVICVLLTTLWRHDDIRPAGPTRDDVFDGVLVRIAAFVVALHVLVLAALTGLAPDGAWAGRAVLVVLGVALVLVGDLMPRIRRNRVIGLTTARALSDPGLWGRTHRAAGYGMVGVGGVVGAAGAFAPGPLMPPIVLSAAAIATALVVGRLYGRSA